MHKSHYFPLLKTTPFLILFYVMLLYRIFWCMLTIIQLCPERTFRVGFRLGSPFQPTCFHWHFGGLYCSKGRNAPCSLWLLQLAGGLTLGGGLRRLHGTLCVYTKAALVLPLRCRRSVLFLYVFRFVLCCALMFRATSHGTNTMTPQLWPELRGSWRGSDRGQRC